MISPHQSVQHICFKSTRDIVLCAKKCFYLVCSVYPCFYDSNTYRRILQNAVEQRLYNSVKAFLFEALISTTLEPGVNEHLVFLCCFPGYKEPRVRLITVFNKLTEVDDDNKDTRNCQGQ